MRFPLWIEVRAQGGWLGIQPWPEPMGVPPAPPLLTGSSGQLLERSRSFRLPRSCIHSHKSAQVGI